ncbi:hypothetical protein B484DRAFT_259255 [Ochromonadaceae sp. CCMP2298]|nr:hypothetical protein B484DRAFT_259255 [Ochromonadaceae sp. CCMP2298]
MEATISDSNLLRINSKAKLVLRAQMRPAPYVPPIEEEAPSSYHSHGTARDGTACRPSNPEVSPHRRGSTRNTSTTTTTTSGANAGTSTGMGEDSARRTGFSAGSPPTSRPSSRPPTPTSGRKSPKHSPRAHEHAHDGNTPPISPDLRTSARGTTVHSKMKKSDVKGKEGITAKPSPSVKPSTFSTPVAVAGF